MAADPSTASDEALDLLLRDREPPWRRLARRCSGAGPRALLGVVVAAGLAVAGLWWLARPDAPPEVSLPMAPREVPSTADVTPTTAAEVVVHVAGAVGRPGIVRLPAGSRWADALDAGGGAGPEADLDRVNLAQPLVDGDRVYVPRAGELVPPAVAGGGGRPAPAAGGDGPAPALVDVNQAGAVELETLPGIGEATAAAILDHREREGPFGAVDELLDVRGIGPAKLEALRDLVTVGP